MAGTSTSHAGPGSRSSRARPCCGTRGRLGHARVTIASVAAGRVGEPRRVACDALLMSGGYTPSVHLFSQSRGKLAWDEARQAFLPGARPSASGRPARAAASTATRHVLNDGAQAGLRGRPVARATPATCRVAGARIQSRLGSPGALPQAGPAASGACVRRLPERRDQQGPRAGDARGVRVDRAHQALHDDRHGDRPGQDVEHERAGDRGRRTRPAAARKSA